MVQLLFERVHKGHVMKFSDRMGMTQPRNVIQKDIVDAPLRNGLWNALCQYCLDNVAVDHSNKARYQGQALAHSLWKNHYLLRVDQIPRYWFEVKNYIEDHYFNGPWYEVYNLIEFVGFNFDFQASRGEFYQECNRELKRHMSGWRFVDSKLAPIIEDAEIKAVEDAIENASGPVKAHLDRSLERLSDRSNPDYRNAIKEAISAVEAQVKITVNSNKGTLGDLLKKMDGDSGLHPALREAFSKLYGYTSGKNGIRHALMEKDDLDQQDALFMLVTCSAFVNLVQAKINP